MRWGETGVKIVIPGIINRVTSDPGTGVEQHKASKSSLIYPRQFRNSSNVTRFLPKPIGVRPPLTIINCHSIPEIICRIQRRLSSLASFISDKKKRSFVAFRYGVNVPKAFKSFINYTNPRSIVLGIDKRN